jgi:hypothetical protein
VNCRPFIVVSIALMLMFCKAATETTTTTSSSTQATATTATVAPTSTTVQTQTVVTQTTTPAAAAPAGTVIATQETNWPGVTADVTEFRRKGNTLTAKVRFTNKGTDSPQVDVNYKEIYLIDTAGGKKYETLRDEKGAFIAALRTGWQDRWYEEIKPGTSQTIWMKFPAPPAEVKAITLNIPKTPPFEDIAIQD